jgi:GntR family transcriptional regulator/MocR family aminotransferase
MSIGRRQELLAYAAQHDAYILEDDYDSEFRYEGYPLPSLQGMDTKSRVIYVGTFSKVLAPTLRLGYVVLPPALVGAFRAWRRATDQGSPLPLQAGLPLSSLRATSSATSPACAASTGRAATRSWRHCQTPRGAGLAGLHVVVRLAHDADDHAVADHAERAGLAVEPLSQYYLGQPPRRSPTPANAWPRC